MGIPALEPEGGARLELSIPPSPTRLGGVRRAARARLRGISEEIADDVVVALNEAATNAVLYGSQGGSPVQVQLSVTGDWVEASVLDHGPQPPPGRPADTDSGELRAGGWGLWLLRQLVDEVQLERVKLGTRVTLRRAISQREHRATNGCGAPPARRARPRNSQRTSRQSTLLPSPPPTRPGPP